MPEFQNTIHWFRRDLRLSDNTALYNATVRSEYVLPAYIASNWKGNHHWTGPGRQAFLSGCLESLSMNIDAAGGRLICRQGDAVSELEKLINESKAEAVFLNRDPDPYGKRVEERVRRLCREKGIEFCDFKDVVLHEADEVRTQSGNPYKVYTPYSKSWFDVDKPESVKTVRSIRTPTSVQKGNLPKGEDWGLGNSVTLLREPGERAARLRLRQAISDSIGEYAVKRDDPCADATSHLGPDLRYGTLSVREIYHEAEKAREEAQSESVRNSIHTFQKQLAWREFFMAILHEFPHVLDTEFNADWRGLEWNDPAEGNMFERWQNGQTGFPIVDAGMRQLAETGYMHNRVRMITAMFLTKDLHVHWKNGEAHFMRHLLDGEIANNNGGWQWSAGTGADAAPYFRIQNPWTQTARFDRHGSYIKRWIPELQGVDPKKFTKPPMSGEKLCPDYFEPIVNHSEERLETLERFKRHKMK